jgi:hypothetical protein
VGDPLKGGSVFLPKKKKNKKKFFIGIKHNPPTISPKINISDYHNKKLIKYHNTNLAHKHIS